MSVEDIRRTAVKILFDAGSVVRTDDPWNPRSGVEGECRFSGYGLEIIGEVPYYNYESSCKKYLKHVVIKEGKGDDKQVVFDSQCNYMKDGTWQDILYEMYDRLPEYKRYKENYEQNMKDGMEFYNKYLSRLHNSCRFAPNISFKYVSDMDLLSEIPFETYEVKENDETVFYLDYNHRYGEDLITFTPGKWQGVIVDYFKKKEEDKERKREEESARQLRRIRSTPIRKLEL